MKKVFTLMMAVIAGIGTMSASDINVDGFWYNFNSDTKTAEVTYKGSTINTGGYSSLTEVVIPETVVYDNVEYRVTSVGEYAFYNCNKLRYLTIPNTITSIGNSAFNGCNLYKIIIPNSVTDIGERAFESSNLVAVTLGSGVKTIGNSAFDYNSNLKSVYISDIAAWCSISFGNYSANPLWKGGKLYLNDELVTDIVIPEGIDEIGNNAFYKCSNITSIVIPNGVTSIGNHAFYYCESLTSVTIPEGVISIGKNAFYGCSSLITIDIPHSVTSLGEKIFEECKNLISATIGNGVQAIPKRSFYNCTNLTSITIGHSVDSIKTESFNNCNNLKSVHISDIAKWCTIYFSGVTSNPFYYNGDLYLNDNIVKDLIIPEGTPCIKDYVFYNCASLTSVKIPNSVTSIGYSAFSWLSSISGPKSTLDSVIIGDGVQTIGEYAFHNRSSIKSVVLGKNIKTIKQGAFFGNPQIPYVRIPESVTRIEKEAFNSGSMSVYITDIAAWCAIDFPVSSANPFNSGNKNAKLYLNDSVLTELVIPDEVSSINQYAFYNYSLLTSVTLGTGINAIGNNAFYGCSNVARVNMHKVEPPLISSACGLRTAATLYVPANSIEAYSTATFWENFSSIRSLEAKVIFKDWNGSEIASSYVADGASATEPEHPTREGYTFIGWDKDFSNVTEDMIVTALYKINRYKVEFIDWNDAVLKSDSVDWNTAAEAPADPTRSGFTFVGWDNTFDSIKSDITIKALYEEGENTDFTVIFNSKEGGEILSYNITLKIPNAPVIEGFTFIGWQPVASILTEEIVIQAIYQADQPSSTPAIVCVPGNDAIKLIKEGNVYILREEQVYTVQGQKVR